VSDLSREQRSDIQSKLIFVSEQSWSVSGVAQEAQVIIGDPEDEAGVEDVKDAVGRLIEEMRSILQTLESIRFESTTPPFRTGLVMSPSCEGWLTRSRHYEKYHWR